MNNFNFQKIQKQFVNKFRNLYSLITKNNIRVFFFIFAIVILTRLPWLILITSDDPGDDSAFYINIAENIVDGDGYVTDFKEVYYESDSVEKIEIENQAFWILPGYSFFLAIVFLFNDSVYFAKIVQTVLFSFLLMVYYSYSKNRFGKKISFLSIILLISDPLVYHNSVLAMSDILSTILIFISLYLLDLHSNSKQESFLYLCAIIAALASLTREINLLLLPTFVLLMLYANQRIKAVKFASVFCLVTVPWYLYQYSNCGYFLPRLHSSKYIQIPDFIPPDYEKKESIVNMILFLFRELYSLLYDDYLISGAFLLLFPFIMVGLIRNIINPIMNYNYALAVALGIFLAHGILYTSMGGHANGRYFFPTYFIILPLGLSCFIDYVDKATEYINNGFEKNKIHKVTLLAVLISFSILFSSATILNLAYEMNENQYDDRETYNWINENVSGDNLIATTNAQRCAYYTDMKCVRLPYNIDESLLEVFILNNGVSILHIEENQIGRYYDYEWVASLFSGSESFNVGKIEFTLVEVYSRPHNQGEVWTYEIQ